MKNHKFQKAVFQIRKKYGRAYLKKSELAEAFKLYKQADENIEKFQSLLRGVHIRGMIDKKQVKDPLRRHNKFYGRHYDKQV